VSFRVLLINPRATYAFEIAQKCYPPLNLLYLATALRGTGIEARVLDTNALAMTDGQIADATRDYGPDLVGVPLYTEIMAPVHRMISALAAAVPGTRFVIGGPHASALPDDVLRQYPQVDFVMRGESEMSFPRLCQLLRDGGDLTAAPGLSFRRGGDFVHNPAAEFSRDLDSLGMPARDLVMDVYERKRYYTLLVRQRPVDTIMTSRGCPFHCNFCYNQNHHYRHRSADHVMEELVSIRRRGIRNVEIVDDTFTFNRDRAMDIFNRLARERLGVSFRIKSRVNVVDAEFLAAARKAGAYLIAYGCESGDDDMLRRMNKRTCAADNERAIRLTKDAGIACHTSWVFGYPGETPESIRRTVDFIARTRPTTAQIALLRPYPQTVAYQEARDLGWLRGDWSVESDEYPWVQLPWAQTRGDLEGCIQRAMRRVYYRPYYVWQFGKMVLAGANVTLARYALQELRKNLAFMARGKRVRSGSV
jgi:radical SAM superfamily enzyme YgiQ (UPF0313 family)